MNVLSPFPPRRVAAALSPRKGSVFERSHCSKQMYVKFKTNVYWPNTLEESIHNQIALQKCLYEAEWQKLCGGTGGPRRKVWTRTQILSLNIRYFAAN